MTPESDRDILIAVKTKVDEIHYNMTQPGGRVPMLEADVKRHNDQIIFWRGALWVVAGLLTLLGGVLVAHIRIH